MVSYSQNGEDIRLRRLYPPDHRGYYVDIGASDPVAGSITKHFYDQGWSGINVEPAPAAFARLCVARPRDTNLNMGVADRPGTEVLYESIDRDGLSTFSAQEAAAHRAAGAAFREVTRTVTTLAAICEEYVREPIDFMSIDVEGYERQVIAGGNWTRWRPLAVVVEATRPNTQIATHEDWEPLLLQADYLFVAFDGLNRYYVRAEDGDLAERLQVPVNVFDDFIPFRYQQEIERLDRQAQSLAAELAKYQDLGPQTLAMARRLKAVAWRFPWLARAARWLFRPGE